jgi:excisionase family DNA binding protein
VGRLDVDEALGERGAVGFGRRRSEGGQVMDKLLLTPEEAGVVLSLGRTTVYGLIARGALRSVRVGRSRRVPMAALKEFVDLLFSEAAQPSIRMGSGRSCISPLTRDQTHGLIGAPMQTGSMKDNQ